MNPNDSYHRTVTTVRYFSYNYVIIPLLKVYLETAIKMNQIKSTKFLSRSNIPGKTFGSDVIKNSRFYCTSFLM